MTSRPRGRLARSSPASRPSSYLSTGSRSRPAATWSRQSSMAWNCRALRQPAWRKRDWSTPRATRRCCCRWACPSDGRRCRSTSACSTRPGHSPAGGLSSTYVRPEGTPVSRAILTAPVTFAGFERVSRRMASAGEHWRISGTADRPFGYLGVSRAHLTARGEMAIAAGRVQRGGITVGLLAPDGRWATFANVGTPGPFTVVLKATPGVRVRLVVADFLPAGGSSDVTLDRIGWAQSSDAPDAGRLPVGGGQP